jgi:hypothetical protein
MGPPGETKKSTALGIGMGLLRKIEGLNIVSEKITPEALIKALQVAKFSNDKLVMESSGVIFAPELAVFLGKQRYNEGLITLLTTFSDAPESFSYTTVGGGKMDVKNVSVTLFGASTVDWLVNAVPHDIFGGGFTSRCIFIYQATTDRIFPFVKPTQEGLADKLVDHLKEVKKLQGQFIMDDDAKSFYERWYHANRIIKSTKQMRPYFNRKPDMLLRVSMLLVLSKLNNFILTKNILQEALHFLDEAEVHLPDLFTEIDFHLTKDIHHKILQKIIREGEVAHEDLIKEYCNMMTSKRLMDFIITLLEGKLIVIEAKGDGRVYKPYINS